MIFLRKHREILWKALIVPWKTLIDSHRSPKQASRNKNRWLKHDSQPSATKPYFKKRSISPQKPRLNFSGKRRFSLPELSQPFLVAVFLHDPYAAGVICIQIPLITGTDHDRNDKTKKKTLKASFERTGPWKSDIR